jgi:Flp pilus assembly pilin Flp
MRHSFSRLNERKKMTMKNILMRLWEEEDGQDLIEYVLLVALVALATAAAFPPIVIAISGVFTKAGTCLTTGTGAGC